MRPYRFTSAGDTADPAHQWLGTQTGHNRVQVFQVINFYDNVKIIEVDCVREHLQLIDVAVQFADCLGDLRQSADLVVDLDLDA